MFDVINIEGGVQCGGGETEGFPVVEQVGGGEKESGGEGPGRN